MSTTDVFVVTDGLTGDSNAFTLTTAGTSNSIYTTGTNFPLTGNGSLTTNLGYI